jgi:predicted transcriptional regulator
MKQLKRLRRDAGLTQYWLASATGIKRWRISHAELGILELTLQEVELVRSALVEACRKRTARVLELTDESEPVGQRGKARLRS